MVPHWTETKHRPKACPFTSSQLNSGLIFFFFVLGESSKYQYLKFPIDTLSPNSAKVRKAELCHQNPHVDSQSCDKPRGIYVCWEITCEEVLLRKNEVVGGFVHLQLALPRLRHVPGAGVAGVDVELRSGRRGRASGPAARHQGRARTHRERRKLVPLSRAEGPFEILESLAKGQRPRSRPIPRNPAPRCSRRTAEAAPRWTEERPARLAPLRAGGPGAGPWGRARAVRGASAPSACWAPVTVLTDPTGRLSCSTCQSRATRQRHGRPAGSALLISVSRPGSRSNAACAGRMCAYGIQYVLGNCEIFL